MIQAGNPVWNRNAATRETSSVMRTLENPMVALSRTAMLCSMFLLILALTSTAVDAKDAGANFDPHPLRPADGTDKLSASGR